MPASDAIISYLEICRDMQRSMQSRRQDFAYLCVDDFLLRHGKAFEPKSFPKKYRRGTPQYCFHNARVLASRSRGSLRYVEGYATTEQVGIPLHHAWTVTKSDLVVDPTWVGPCQTPSAYFGVIIPIEIVRSAQTKDNCSVLYDYIHGFPILRSEWPY